MIETVSRLSYTVITQVLLFWTESITEVVWASSFVMCHEMSKKGVGKFLHSPAVALTHFAATCAHSAAVFTLILLLLSSLPCPILPGARKTSISSQPYLSYRTKAFHSLSLSFPSQLVSVERWLAELRVASWIPSRGRQQYWEGKHCSKPPFSVRDVKPWAPCVEISARITHSPTPRRRL